MMTSDCNQFDIIKEALHLSNVVINNVSHEEEEGISRIVVDLRPTDDVINCCPHCGNICDYYDHQRMNGLSHTETMAKIREQSDIMFPKKLITPFLRIFVTSKDLNFDYSGERHEW